MTIPEESRPQTAGTWYRRILHAPSGAAWLPEVLETLQGTPALPSLRELRAERDGRLTIEEHYGPDLLPLGVFLAKAAAPLWVFVSVVHQSLTGLARLHECGLMHGAISPETLLINSGGNVVLANAGGGLCPSEWQTGTVEGRGKLLRTLAVRDLKDLGRVFRAVLGGNAETKMTVSRPDIAPLVSEWIDWLAAPEPGREPLNATQAESVFADIRTGRAGLRPWQNKLELPPEVEFSGPKQAAALSPEELKKLRRAARDAHGSGLSVRNQILLAILVLALAGGGIYLADRFYGEQPVAAGNEKPLQLPDSAPGFGLGLADEAGNLYAASMGDVEPLADTGDTIAKLMKILGKDMQAGSLWEKELLRRKKEREGAAEAAVAANSADSFLYETTIFPAMGKASAGTEPGDYYLVWRTRNFLMTPEECQAVQSAVLRCTRYCGVRLMAWTTLPNQAAVILRVLPRQSLPDERLERRIAILRGDKTAASVIAQVNAKLKAGDDEGAQQIRKQWTASMGSASGFFSVIKTVPVVNADALQGRLLWQDKPLHLSFLNPETPEVLQAAAIVDIAAVKGRLVEKPSAWPLCGLRAAAHNYAPALRAIAVLMQRKPQLNLPPPPKEEILKSFVAYRRYIGDLPKEPEPTPKPASFADGEPAVLTPPDQTPPKSAPDAQGNKPDH